MFGHCMKGLGSLIRLTLILLMGVACLAVCANPTFARGPAVRVQTGRANVQQFRQQPVIVQQQLGFGSYGGVQAIVQPQCVGGSCGQLLLVR
jgi:hypothetical protein